MSLADHLRELRYRVVFSFVVIIVGMIVMAFFYAPLYNFLLQPWTIAVEELSTTRPEISTAVVNIGVTAPFTLAMKITAVAGIVLTCPIWLYQLWAFVVPALKASEKKWALIFLAAAVPLFVSGVIVGYIILPKGISVMLSFTPEAADVTNMLDITSFLTMLVQLMLASGIAFLLPVFLIALNFIGVLKGVTLGKYRSYAIFGCFVFGAIVTPSTDPFSMSALAIPMSVLYVIAEIVCRSNDKRRAKKGDTLGLAVEL
jgi:sec-independent protein translocase protein TatC